MKRALHLTVLAVPAALAVYLVLLTPLGMTGNSSAGPLDASATLVSEPSTVTSIDVTFPCTSGPVASGTIFLSPAYTGTIVLIVTSHQPGSSTFDATGGQTTLTLSGETSKDFSIDVNPAPEANAYRVEILSSNPEVANPTAKSDSFECPAASATFTPTSTPTPTETPIKTSTATPTETPIKTSTATPTKTPMETSTATPIETAIETSTATPTETPMETPTATPAETLIETPTNTPVPPTSTPGEGGGEAGGPSPSNTPVPPAIEVAAAGATPPVPPTQAPAPATQPPVPATQIPAPTQAAVPPAPSPEVPAATPTPAPTEVPQVLPVAPAPVPAAPAPTPSALPGAGEGGQETSFTYLAALAGLLLASSGYLLKQLAR